jgi:hypothetical protein
LRNGLRAEASRSRQRRRSARITARSSSTPQFKLKLIKDSQTIAALEPKGAKGIDTSTPFDFTER